MMDECDLERESDRFPVHWPPILRRTAGPAERLGIGAGDPREARGPSPPVPTSRRLPPVL